MKSERVELMRVNSRSVKYGRLASRKSRLTIAHEYTQLMCSSTHSELNIAAWNKMTKNICIELSNIHLTSKSKTVSHIEPQNKDGEQAAK